MAATLEAPALVSSLGVLYDGDALHVLAALAPQTIDLLVVDPPGEDLIAPVLQEAQRLLKPTGSLYIFGASGFIAELKARHAREFSSSAWLIWHHARVSGHGRAFGNAHESILHLRNAQFALRRSRSSHKSAFAPPLSDVLSFPPPTGREKLPHPSQKPVALMRALIAAATQENGCVLDPFAGTGSTLAACEDLGRAWIGCEISSDCREMIASRLLRSSRLNSARAEV